MTESKSYRQIAAEALGLSVEQLESLSKKDLDEKCEAVWRDGNIGNNIPSDFDLPWNYSSYQQFIAYELGKIIKRKSSQFLTNPGIADGGSSSSAVHTNAGRYRKR